jgi:hypothetical protein
MLAGVQCLAVAFGESPNPEPVDLHPGIMHQIIGVLDSDQFFRIAGLSRIV